MAEEDCAGRVKIASSQTTLRTNPTSIGHEWIYRFLKRHAKFKGVYSRLLESARYKEATPLKISAWFDTFKARIEERKYKPCNNIVNALGMKKWLDEEIRTLLLTQQRAREELQAQRTARWKERSDHARALADLWRQLAQAQALVCQQHQQTAQLQQAHDGTTAAAAASCTSPGSLPSGCVSPGTTL
ncbi:hypothetical protein V493_02126 [Pseudogymnoascus sp. VKM F-4281 (FW-2241)]|nr:hypothetical protein V493_02126 [Pseudogymnoascus sp. VKM F-4281 (FW-2241)]